jgi:hypothetical protein
MWASQPRNQIAAHIKTLNQDTRPTQRNATKCATEAGHSRIRVNLGTDSDALTGMEQTECNGLHGTEKY